VKRKSSHSMTKDTNETPIRIDRRCVQPLKLNALAPGDVPRPELRSSRSPSHSKVQKQRHLGEACAYSLHSGVASPQLTGNPLSGGDSALTEVCHSRASLGGNWGRGKSTLRSCSAGRHDKGLTLERGTNCKNDAG
jgi:hypothetical protein